MIYEASNPQKKTTGPAVSVIIPTHNRGAILRRAIDSVLNQTYKDFELIIISDGCIDNTDEIIASYADLRISFLTHEKSRGASAARNTGIRASTGQYIAFLDDDDEWTPDKLEVQIHVIEQSPPEVGLVYAWMEYIENGKKRYIRAPKLRGDIFAEMLDKQAITNSSTLIIKREVLDVVHDFDEELPRGNDGDFIRRISKYYHVDYVPKILARIHMDGADRISVNSKKNLRNVVFALEKRLDDFAKDFERYPEQKASVMANISSHGFKTGQLSKGITFLGRVIGSEGSWHHKMQLLFRIGKSIIKQIDSNSRVIS
jgi:glycosyltransferase involved in cell wall biosynthesis